MYNKVTLENPTRKRLDTAVALLALYAVLTAICLIMISISVNNNYNGQTVKVEGVVKEVYQNDGDTYFLHLENDSTDYTTSHVEGACNWESLVGKQVELWLPQNQKIVRPALILGISVEGVQVVDAQQVIEAKRETSKITVTAFAISCGILCVATCAVAIWRINIAPSKEYPLAQKYAEYYAEKQPLCPQHKHLKIFLFVWIALLVAEALLIAILNSVEEQSDQLNFAFVGILIGTALVGVAVTLLLSRKIEKLDMDFYEARFPFDFTDISHMHLRKYLKEELQKQIIAEQKQYEDFVGDGGNGYMTRFTPNGLDLFNPYSEAFNMPVDAADNVDTAEIFGEDYGEKPIDLPMRPDFTLPYEKLNLEALAIRPNHYPLMVVVKTRMEHDESLPEDFKNDLHFLLDTNFLATLKKFDVKVENLDYILENKRKCMEELKENKKKRTKAQQ